MNAHLERAYLTETDRPQLQSSERAQQHGIILPLIPSMTTSQVQEVCDRLAAALARPAVGT